MSTEFSKPRCGHSPSAFASSAYTDVCRHVYFDKVVEGVKHYVGNEWQRNYRCEDCAKHDRPTTCQLCASCIARIESEGAWTVTGSPGIKRKPEPFHFSSREISLDDISTDAIKQLCPIANHISDALIFTHHGQVWRACLTLGNSTLIASLDAKQVDPRGDISIVISHDQRYAAITSCVVQPDAEQNDTRSNRGVVLDLYSGEKVMTLSCGDYHVELAPFPVAFAEHQGHTIVIHASDWNHLDVTDLETGECITQRDPDNAPDADDENIVFTEWSGQLLVSPDQKRVATIGWVWHPVGVAFSWSLEDWLTKNVWEPDLGKSKRHYATWEYFWHAPFFWSDNQTLCIWGAPELHTDQDIPMNSAVLYDVESEQEVNVFAGPTMDVFYFDQYLFSGNAEGDGITVWSLVAGTLLHEEPGIKPIAYHAGLQEFIEIKNDEIVLWKWEKGG